MENKKKYEKPELKTYGDVRSNTHAKTGTGGDNQGFESN